MRKRTRTKYGVSITAEGIKRRQCPDYFTGEMITFDSELEKRYYEEVVLAGLKSGEMINYKLQQRYILQPTFKYKGKTVRSIYYISDFDIWYADGSFVVVDVKGRPSEGALLKKKMFEYKYPDIDFRWMAHSKDTGWVEYDVLKKIRKEKKEAKK